MKTAALTASIIRYLSILSKEIEISNSLNLTDLNIYAEDFYAKLLNLVFDYQLINANSTINNATAIDLVDEERGIAIQVTASSEMKKYKETVEKFVKKNLHVKYKKLIILILTKKKYCHKTRYIKDGEFVFDIKNDVWDVDKMLLSIKGKELHEVQNILAFVKSYLAIEKQDENMGIVNNFNFNGANINDSIFNLGGTQNIEKKEIENHFDRAVKLFINHRFFDAKKIFSDMLAVDPSNKEVCKYYVLSSISNVEIANIDQFNINYLYSLIESVEFDEFMSVLWLIIFFESNKRKNPSVDLLSRKNKLMLNFPYHLENNEKILLSNLQLSSHEAPMLIG